MNNRLVGTAISMIIVIMMSTFIPTLATVETGQHDDDWYMTVNGVLDSDYYTLYPYDTPSFESLNIGFSKYGELIGSDPSVPPDDVPPATSEEWVGLDLGGRDPFANPDVPMERWINGWMIDIEYIHTSPVIDPDRHVWAMALFSDGGDWGYDWIQTDDPTSAPYGGRKTNTRVETDDIKVIYDGPRRFVAQMRNQIWDQEPGLPDWPVVNLTITIDFNKVKHQVKLIKDIKLTIPSKDLDGRMNVEFSEREEWDLGPKPSFYSYAHLYEEILETCYGTEWHLANEILRHWEGYKYGDYGTTYSLQEFISPLPKTPVASGYEKVYIAGELMRPPSDYLIDYEKGVIAFTDVVEGWQKIEVICKYVDKPEFPHLYDLAQFISADMQYVGWSAYWPVLSQFTVDGWDKALEKLINIKIADGASEPFIPFMIAQWDFLLDPADIPQYRVVDVKGVTNYHNAEDMQMGAGYGNVVDAEVMYQLNEIFNPWDLRQAAHKETMRWVEFFTGDGVTQFFYLDNAPVVVDSFWTYNGFPERVLLNGVLQHRDHPQTREESYINIHREYALVVDRAGVGSIYFYTPPPKGAVIKVLYSTRETIVAPGELVQLGLTLDSSGSISSGDFAIMLNGTAKAVRNNLPHDGTVELTVVQFGSAASLEVTPTVITQANFESVATTIESITKGGGSTAMAAGLNLTWFEMKNSPNAAIATKQIINLATDGDPNVLLPINFTTGNAYDDVTLIRNNAASEAPYLDELDAEAIGLGPDVTWMRDGVVWPQPGTIAPPHDAGWVEHVADADAFAEAIVHKFEIIIPPPKGRYEWAIVGRDSRATDSAGASMVTAAFKNKGIELGLSGLDMKDNSFGPRIPYVHTFFTGDGTVREGYYDMLMRTALKDDYCRTWPVASSNIITVGGPAANLDSEYWNDFTDAFMTGPPYGEWAKYGIYLPSSWDYYMRYAMPPGNGWGFGIVSTYKDLNGTVGFIAWGWTGEDTYFITKWLHDGGLIELQDMNPCATTVFLYVDYTYHTPRTYVGRTLGTISEKPQHLDP
ncbi:MAG: VWA domain-containing protein [Candidatus Bathyarchaeota archaeon]|nr:VWA domain-containing protein [Candidatus Bathyarchaeota archaeon]